MVILLLLSGCSSKNKSEHPFDKLYKGQTQESVRAILGDPVGTGETRRHDSHYGAIDIFEYEFLGEVGLLKISYEYEEASKTEKLYFATFEYGYPQFNADGTEYIITNLDKDKVREYTSKIISYYTKKFGTPEDDIYDYEWYLKDGTMIEMDDATVEPYGRESCIKIRWE